MLPISEIMTRSVLTATPDMTLQEALELLCERHVGGLPVLEGERVVGIFSATDLISYIAELSETTQSVSFKRTQKRTAVLEDATVGDVMTRSVHSLPPDATLDQAASLMSEKQIHRIVVMDGPDLAGIVCASDVAKAVAAHRIRTRTHVFA